MIKQLIKENQNLKLKVRLSRRSALEPNESGRQRRTAARAPLRAHARGAARCLAACPHLRACGARMRRRGPRGKACSDQRLSAASAVSQLYFLEEKFRRQGAAAFEPGDADRILKEVRGARARRSAAAARHACCTER